MHYSLTLLLLAAIAAVAQTNSPEFPRHDASALPITAKIHIGGDPDWLAIGFRSVWVAVPKTNEIVRIDPEHNQIQARIPVDQEPCYGIAIGPTRIWVLNCKSQTLTRIDPRSNQIDLRVPVAIAPEGEGSIAVGYNSVWFISNEDGHSSTLVQIDPVHGNTRKKIKVGKDSAVVTLGFGSVWVTSSGENAIYRVNPRNGRVMATIAVAAAPRFTTAYNNFLWVLSQSDGSASRIDPAKNKVDWVANARVPGAGGDICGGRGFIWVAAAGTPVTRISSKSGRVIDQYGNYPGADAIRFGFSSVWVSDHTKGDLWRMDPNKLPL
jgi:streptogramin lyase